MLCSTVSSVQSTLRSSLKTASWCLFICIMTERFVRQNITAAKARNLNLFEIFLPLWRGDWQRKVKCEINTPCDEVPGVVMMRALNELCFRWRPALKCRSSSPDQISPSQQISAAPLCCAALFIMENLISTKSWHSKHRRLHHTSHNSWWAAQTSLSKKTKLTSSRL